MKGLLAVILMISLWTLPGFAGKSCFTEHAKSQNELILSNRKIQKVSRVYHLNFNTVCVKSSRADLYKTRFEQRIQTHNILAKNKIKHISDKLCSVESFHGFRYSKIIPLNSDNSDSFSFPRG